MIEFRPTPANFPPTIIELGATMRLGRLQHDGNPVLELCAGNVVGKPDRRGNLSRPRRDRSRRSALRLRSSWRLVDR